MLHNFRYYWYILSMSDWNLSGVWLIIHAFESKFFPWCFCGLFCFHLRYHSGHCILLLTMDLKHNGLSSNWFLSMLSFPCHLKYFSKFQYIVQLKSSKEWFNFNILCKSYLYYFDVLLYIFQSIIADFMPCDVPIREIRRTSAMNHDFPFKPMSILYSKIWDA